MENVKYELFIAGYEDKEMMRNAEKFLGTFYLAKDFELKAISYEEYIELVKKKEIKDTKYWRIKKDCLGFIIKTEALKYSKTWSEMKQSFSDFKEGWVMCKKFLESK